jgi:hypothetical protein
MSEVIGARVHREAADCKKIVVDWGYAVDWVHYRGLEQAASSDDLACLNGDMLVIVWPGPFLPKGARPAGEDEHAALRSAARSA